MHEPIVAPSFVFNNIDCVPGSLLGLKNITLEKNGIQPVKGQIY